MSARYNELRHAQSLAEEGHWEECYDIVYKWLKINPNDGEALNLLGYIMLNTEKCAVAYPILKHLVSLEPTNSLAWLNMGMAAADLWRYEEAKRCYKKGIKYAQNDGERSMVSVNMASTMVDHGDFEDAYPYCEQAIALRDETKKGRANLGFCQLAVGEFDPGWKNYRYVLGSESRPTWQYNDEPLWDGESKGTICIYTEQGIGDEISFATMLPDMVEWCEANDSRLIVDTNPRLEALFKRSFPDVEVHGTRGQSQINWDPSDIDYSLPMGQLGEYFRLKKEDFPGVAHLTPDPERVLQWKALFATKKKPVIGIAWRGGIWKTAAKYRQMTLDTLSPILEGVDAHFVSLQYKPAQAEIDAYEGDAEIIEYSHGTLSGDYDDTVAMIAALDMVVTMQTAVVHVAGGLGIPCWTFIPKSGQWRYGVEGEEFVWADSVRLIRQNERGEWDDVVESTAKELQERFSATDKRRLSKAARNAA